MGAPEPISEAYTGKRCLVTGGAGFIGSNLTRRLLASGASVLVVDDLSTGRREHLPDDPRLELVVDDLCSLPDLSARLAGMDVVFHLAAQVGNVKSIAQAERDARVNVLGTVRLLEACRDRKPGALVYSSSSAIFGEAEVLPIAEDHPQRPASFYALSKATGERYALLAWSLWGVPTVCLRYFNVYGAPMEDNEYTGVISIFLNRLAMGRELTIYGDGRQVRDFVYVQDVVTANLLAGMRAAPGAVYNVGSGRPTDIACLAQAICAVAGVEPRVERRPARAGEVRDSLADISRAREELGFVPAWSLEAGLAELWKAMTSGAAG